VSALVTVLGLLLVVTFIANFVLLQLPGQMQELEFEHTLQVENQLARLQATILAQANNPNIPLTLSSPITLGSQSLPPFGIPTIGTVGAEPPTVRGVSTVLLSQVYYTYPTWNVGVSCLAGGGGHCSGAGHVNYYNESGMNNTNFTVQVNGNTNSLVYNLSGSNDSLSITWTGKDAGFILVIVNGSYDSVVFNKGGSDTIGSVSYFDFFGEHDTFSYNPSGSHASSGSQSVNVAFVGQVGPVCPAANLSSTDNIAQFSSGGSNINVNVTWWNAQGYITPPHVTPFPGGSVPAEQITWQNRSGFVACAFSKTYGTAYQIQFGGGLDVRLANRYSPISDVAYDQGAVILAQQGGTPVMVSPPRITTSLLNGGIAANITLVNLLGNLTTESGVTTAAVTSHVVSVDRFTIAPTAGLYLGGQFYLNITTLYPGAWAGYFGSFPQAFPAGSTCVPLGTIPAPFTCLDPPPGTVVEVVAPMFLQELTFTSITATIGLI
jgi:hypothetical protein